MIVKIKKTNKNTYWYKYMTDCSFEVLDTDNTYTCIRCLDVNKCTAIPDNNFSNMYDKIKRNDFHGCYIDKDDVYTVKELRKQKIKKVLV